MDGGNDCNNNDGKCSMSLIKRQGKVAVLEEEINGK